ncbi:cell envelope biogenesis protein OmpA [Dokdonia pacifica]|uniref:Outer membrane protein OmpA n=1 Tax=Dokdonia pacifica TaxID=1627892 RepID=A0A238ZYI7_9FLAO|nr:OmpA family protein [Dokdonia pacifica]GGG33806.1 cell envelope biogenesis protein OmpA [Dokdonia pacifica]SNR87938.1 Outer membrane protein OmpA [Dokdonia pacifica]
MKLHVYILTALFSLVGVTSFAQEGKISRADKKFDQYAFVDARKIYLDVAEKGYESADLFQKLADSYYFNAEYTNAEVWYKKLIDTYQEEVQPEYYFRYSQTLRALKNYELADAMMTRFNDLNGTDTRATLFKESPDYLREISEYKKSKYTLEDIRSINSRYSDFAPTEFEGKLIFASTRDSGGSVRRIHKWNNQPFLDLYQTRIGEQSGSFSKPSKFNKKLNSKFHESTTAFSKDGSTVYFTRNNYTKGSYKKDKNGTNKLKIYKSTREEGKGWTEAVEMPFNSDEYSTAHPALNADNTKLYFASDMEGTIGLSDIWVVDINEDGTYGTPVNVGRPINTEGRETFPFMSKNGNLYFASDGHPGLGGLDVYVTSPQLQNDEQEIINVGKPINSSYDDFTFIVNDETKLGYFASNRKTGMGSDDIYRFVQEIIPCDILVDGKVIDKDSGDPISGATVQLIDSSGEVVTSMLSETNGGYNFDTANCEEQYIVRAIKETYNGDEVVFTTPDESKTITNNLRLELAQKPIEVGDDLTVLLELNPIYFDFDRFNIRPDAALELEKVISVMKQYPTMVIDARSHTDSRGVDSYNLSLSDKRAKSTVAYIISQGIESSRISGAGYGETQLVNDCGNDANCSEEDHQLNRRSEFIVIKK